MLSTEDSKYIICLQSTEDSKRIICLLSTEDRNHIIIMIAIYWRYPCIYYIICLLSTEDSSVSFSFGRFTEGIGLKKATYMCWQQLHSKNIFELVCQNMELSGFTLVLFLNSSSTTRRTPVFNQSSRPISNHKKISFKIHFISIIISLSAS